jgi:aminoglycoside 6-adenylyltransferase
MDNFLTQVVSWARNKKDIKALLLVGSRARNSKPADEWSDYDIVMFVDDPEVYIKNDSWLDDLGRVVLSFIEKCALGDSFEHRVLFDSGRDVDFIIDPVSVVKSSAPASLPPAVLDIYHRGYRVLLDNIGLASALEKLTSTAPPAHAPPPQELFTNVINDFFYHCVWTVKKLMRGELWTAKHCLNDYMQKNCLLPMIEWHTQAHNKEGIDTWFSGRFMEKWADKKILARLNKIDARCERKDIIRALYMVIDLFHELAGKTADLLHYTYEHKSAEWTRNWIKKTVSIVH